MKLTQVKGNTYVLEGWELIPLYVMGEGKCILLDTGLQSEREEIEASLARNGLTPAGILNSHAHTDHSFNDRYFQEKYRIPVAMPAGEAALCSSLLTLKCYYFMFSPEAVRSLLEEMVLAVDLPIGREDGPLDFLGATFQILHTPGHAPDHISVITPDGVCYVGDAILSTRPLKLPYSIAHGPALDSAAKLREVSCASFILAHRGIFDDIRPLADGFRRIILDTAARIAALVRAPMTEGEVCAAVAEEFQLLSSRTGRALGTARNVHAYLEFLLDRGDLILTARRGVRYYLPSPREVSPSSGLS